MAKKRLTEAEIIRTQNAGYDSDPDMKKKAGKAAAKKKPPKKSK